MSTKLHIVSWQGAGRLHVRYFHCEQTAAGYAKGVSEHGYAVTIESGYFPVEVPGIA